MAIRAFVEQLNSVGPDRMRSLGATISNYFVYVGPENAAAVGNRAAWDVAAAIAPCWGWYVCSPDQAADVAKIHALDFQLEPKGWLLNIEKPLEGAPLKTLIEGVAALGRPMIASLGGSISASHINFDYRTLDKHGVACDWQAYFDSGEGVDPRSAVTELYESSFVIPGWEYRHRLGTKYGFGKVSRIEASQRAMFDSYLRPGGEDGYFAVSSRAWGYNVVARGLIRTGQNVGRVMGRAAYSKIAVTLDTTRTAQARKAAEWTPIAASARADNAARRPVSVYLLDVTSDAVVQAIAAGAL